MIIGACCHYQRVFQSKLPFASHIILFHLSNQMFSIYVCLYYIVNLIKQKNSTQWYSFFIEWFSNDNSIAHNDTFFCDIS